MTGEYRTGARILAALADAPMNAEALMHELEINRRQLGLALSHLVKQGRIEQDDRGCWFLVKADAAPLPVVSTGQPPTAGSATVIERNDNGWKAAPPPPADAIADVVQQLTAPRPATSISVGDQVLQILIAAGRITQDDVRLASQLIGARA